MIPFWPIFVFDLWLGATVELSITTALQVAGCAARAVLSEGKR